MFALLAEAVCANGSAREWDCSRENTVAQSSAWVTDTSARCRRGDRGDGTDWAGRAVNQKPSHTRLLPPPAVS